MGFKEDFHLIKKLTEIQSCSGNESAIRDFIKGYIQEDCDSIEIDALGNLHCFVFGEGKEEGEKLKILFDAHMDEIGFIVRFIDKNGFLRFSQIGGQNVRILPGQKVHIHATSGDKVIGIIGEKPIHLIKKKERKKTSDIEDLFIDVGMSSKEEVEEIISVGDYITLSQECTSFFNKKRFFTKALDDRAGCFVLIKLIKEFSQSRDTLNYDLIFQFAAQEEIGVRGATTGSYKISPDLAIVLEVTHAVDYPGINKDKHFDCALGAGVSISVGPNVFSKLSKLLIETAKEAEIPYILEARNRPAPNDARAIQMTKAGIPCAIVTTPLRYMHTNIETIEYQDLIHTVNLLKAILQKDLVSHISL